ncbi:GLPGLI family protein [Chryseobacterium taklimakanense]|uniref:GLPGLI family protein n=1 Tax=Chryseobacterium taklimakanense TaxID=536441 RepID=A0A239XPP7_9FLAO|nr:GLPGLI family protein [Chryseobacterium taklimakanense]SNV48360.1 GLPGLI family protein [Chryseobacterium taklimakanense]
MKKIITLFLLIIITLFNGQTWNISYEYKVKNLLFNDEFTFPASLIVDNKEKSLYTVQFGIVNQIDTKVNAGAFSLIDRSSYKYVLFSNKPNAFTIGDEINGKKYIFKDSIPVMDYEIKNESKLINNIKLYKAEVLFRGRKYVIWHDPYSKIKAAPWKFANFPGLAYEIYDEDNLFRWTLQKIEKSESEIRNPVEALEVNNNFLSYVEYPKLKYPSIYIQDEVKNNSINKSQNRDGLEKLFEWEK